MKVALVGSGLLPVPPMGYGAVESHVWELYNHLKAAGIDVTIVNKVFGSEYRFIPWAVAGLRVQSPDIIHAHTSAVGATLALLHDNLVFTSHNPAWTVEAMDIMSWWGLNLEKLVGKRAAAFIALDGRVAARAGRYARHLHIVHGAIDPGKWRASSLDGGFTLSVGKLERRKGFHKFAAQRGDVHYAVAGKSVGDRKYESQLLSLGVELHTDPSDEEIRHLYSTASVYVHPSEFDAFSLAVLEAMASGLPIVASEVCAEQVVNGENGFLVADENYSEPVERLISDEALRRRMGGRSRDLVVSRFSWDSAVNKIIAIYEGALGRR